MKLIRLFFILLLANFIFCSDLLAQTFPRKPAHGLILDEAAMIDTADKEAIYNISENLLKEEHVPIVIVTINSLAEYQASSIEEYATALFNNWGIGYQKLNYGVLLLIAKNDHKARIEFGKDFDHRYDNEARKIMDDKIIPNFKKGEFSKGILFGVQNLDALVRGLELPKEKMSTWEIISFIAGIIFVIAAIISLFKSGRSGWAWALIIFLGVILSALFWLSRLSGGGFGGGFGGGGGASGSW
jgi:uncharacterized protein